MPDIKVNLDVPAAADIARLLDQAASKLNDLCEVCELRGLHASQALDQRDALQRELDHERDNLTRALALLKAREAECEALRKEVAASALLRDRLAHAERMVADMRWLLDRVKDPA